MHRKKTATIADAEGPWVEPEFNSGLIERCKRGWNTPIGELTNELLATYLRQKLALRLVVPEARKRLADGYVDGTELYDEELANALSSVAGETWPATGARRPRPMSIPPELKASLEHRICDQIASEVRGDVSALYNFTLPSIRASRIAERDDEPAISLSEIKKFVDLVHDAEVDSIEIEQFVPSLARYSACPGALVITRVRYNSSSEPTKFRSIWVYSEGTWFTTALHKALASW